MAMKDPIGRLLALAMRVLPPWRASDGDSAPLKLEVERLRRRLKDQAVDLRQSEQRFRDFAEASSDWFWEQDADLRFTEIMLAHDDMTGIRPEKFLGKTRRECEPSGLSEADWADHDARLARREPFSNLRFTQKHADTGRDLEISISGKPVFDADGTFQGYRGAGSDVTVEVEASVAAERERQRFADALECMEDGFALFDADGRLDYCNQAFRRVNPGAVIGGKTRLEDFVERATDAGERVLDEPVLRNDHWLIERTAQLLDGSTGLAQIDVTELKRREQTIAEREQRFRDFAELSADWFWELDENLCFTLMSEKFSSLGMDPNEIIGKNRRSWHSPHLAEGGDPEPDAFDKREGFREIEHESIFKAGVWVSTSAKPLFDDDGTFTGYRGVTQDITGRRNVMRQADDERAMYRDILNAAPVGVSLVDSDGDLVFANTYQAERWGYDPVVDAGRSMYDLVDPALAETARLQNHAVVTTGDPLPFEQYVVPMGAGARTVMMGKRPVALLGHDRPGVCTIIADVTERVEAERSRHDAELQLAQAQRLETVGQLTGGVAHDINNILSIIVGSVELLELQLEDRPEAAPLLAAIESSADRGADLVDRLLSYARRRPLQAASANVADIVGDIEVLLRRTIGADVVLTVSAAEGLWTVDVDRSQFESALINLALNARDAMPDGGALSVDISNVAADGRAPDDVVGEHVCIVISDTGVGIAPEDQPRIFDPFFTTKEFGKGSGLGLSMVYGFVKQSGGHITVESSIGGGARIAIYLPRGESKTSVPPEVEVAPATFDGSSRILVVEDDEQLRAIPVKLLAAQGYQVAEAATGPEAIALVEGGARFDLLFTDVILPGGVNGVQLADRLRAIDPEIKILFTSGYPENALLEVDGAGGKLIGKPYRGAELVEAIRSALR